MSENIWEILKENQLRIENEISNDLKCKICNKLMIRASSAPCGCRFCSDCIEHYLGGNNKFCPGSSKHCQKKMINYANDIATDNAINIRISEIIVKCPTNNCEFKDELGVIENHTRTCNKRPITCPFREIGCETNEVINGEMKEHLNDNNYCHNKLLIDLINNLRNEVASMRNEIFELKKEKQKLENVDYQRTNQQKMGEMKRKENENSAETDVKKETLSLRKEIKANAESIKEMIQTKSEQQINELKQNYKQWQKKANEEIEMLRNFNMKFDEKNTNISRSDNHDETFKQIIDGKVKKLEMKMIEIESSLENKKFGKFDWKIDRLSKQRGSRIYSEPFYSEQLGHKMCLSIQIRFDACYIYFHLMRGLFDNICTWPFQYSLTIDVIDQENGNIYQRKTMKYSDWPDHAGWTKPVNDRNDGIWFNDIAIPIDSPAIKNDQVIVKCRVEREIKLNF